MTRNSIIDLISILVSQFFERSNDQVVTYDVIDEVMYGKLFRKCTPQERTEIALEAISRLEGEYCRESAAETIHEYHLDYFADPYAA